VWRAAGIAAALCAVAALALPWGVFDGARYGDEHLYLDYGARMLDGDVPYRDFYVEYPPGALPVFVVPAAFDGHDTTAFRLLMAACFALASAAAVLLAGRRGRISVQVTLAVVASVGFVVAFAPLLLNTYDAWPALLVTAGLVALLRRHHASAGAALGLATAAKLLPVLLLPIALLYAHAHGGARRLVVGAVAATGVVTLPFLLLAPTGLGYSVESQLRRGLHVESVPATLLLLADRIGLVDARTQVQPPGSLNLTGSLAGAVGTIAGILLLVAVAFATMRLRAVAHDPRLALVSALAVVLATFALAKVLSAQFLVWGAPLLAAAGSPAAVALFGVAAGLSISWTVGWASPFDLDGEMWWAVVRNGLLAILLLLVLRQLRRERTQADDGSREHDQVA
jgi:uncharacterized membrane protein